MAKILEYDEVVREAALKGITKLEKAVGSTLGPCGRNVLIDKNFSVHVTKDGVTVADEVELKDPIENAACKLVKEVAQKTNTMVGDGTTTSTVLASSIYRNGLKHLALGANGVQLKNGIQKTADFIIDLLKKNAKKISSKEELMQVATISANGDKEIGEVIADVMTKIGNDGTIKVEDGNTTTMQSKIVEGMQFDRGYISPYFITNDKLEADLDSPFIILADKKISNVQDLLPALQPLSQTGKPILIIAEDIDGEALSTIVMNRLRGLQICAVRSPSYGQNRKNIMEDIAILTGGKVVSEETGVTFAQAVPGAGAGQAKRVIVTKDSTTIIGSNTSKVEVDERVDKLKKELSSIEDEFEKNHIRERIAKLAGGVGIIQVGAQTEAELKEKKDRVDDAFNATKAAVKDGIIPGGGASLMYAKYKFDEAYRNNEIEFVGNESLGAMIMAEALEAPMKTIMNNAGVKADYICGILAEDIKKSENLIDVVGYNALSRECVKMIDNGIVDPCAVTTAAVQNAASIAGLLLTTNCIIVDEPEIENKAAQGQMQMPMM